MEKNKKPHNKKVTVLIIILSVIVVVTASILIFMAVRSHLQKQKVNDVVETVEVDKDAIDFDALQRINADAYAWIKIDGTEVSYPVLQHPTENDYYLDTTLEGEKGLPGALYTQNYNSKSFDDVNTIIYGHNMRNGTMFGRLYEYRDDEYRKQHSEMKIILPDKKLRYKLLAVCESDDDHLLNKYNSFKSSADTKNFLKELENVGVNGEYYDDSYIYSEGDKFVTLSTCINGKNDKRLLVVFVKE